ncbi:MAG TPA: glutamate--tRNA ligase, partial [Longimicrobiales bacterium]|nr:glutamate--tRNA ligase [Longimicrobiales bacterium]
GAGRSLVAEERAYPCYCTDEELAADLQSTPGGEVAHYPGRCRSLTRRERDAREREGRKAAVRFRMPDLEVIEVTDEIRGSITFPSSDFDDFILLRRDGRPTYNFAVVVDDALMEITHVIRGAGHLSNTPRQALLFDALDRRRPHFVHLPTVLAPEGGKLSKRSGSASLDALREAGYHPEGVVNYLSLLGWSSPDEREILGRLELVERIGLDRVGARDTTYDPEKLRWMSGQYLQAMDPDDLVRAVEPFVDRRRFPLSEEGLRAAVSALRSRLSTFADIVPHLETHLFPAEGPELRKARREVGDDPRARRVLEAVARTLQAQRAWDAETLDRALREAGREISEEGPGLFHPVRKALTGRESGPALGALMAALGRDQVLARLRGPLAPASHGLAGPDRV